MADPVGEHAAAADAFDLEVIGAGLPFAEAVPRLRAALTGADGHSGIGHSGVDHSADDDGGVDHSGVAVVQAPPGSGKTALVPPLVANTVPGRIVVTQPRRIAVRAAARRLVALTGDALGERVGYTVRGERHVGRATRIEFCTPGVLLRRLLSDPELPGVGAVVLDEVHERGLDTDLLVGMLAQVRELREDLGLVAMSATLDAPRFAALLGGGTPAPIVDSAGALHPLSVRWAPPPGPRFDARGVSREFLQHVAQRTVEAVRETAGATAPDVLVFVPGAWEVGRVAMLVREGLVREGLVREGLTAAHEVEVLELHGQIPPGAQDRVTSGRRAGEPRRVVVSTAIAESSLTVPGIRLVVDAGLSREPRRDASRGMSGLVTVAASQDAAIQRAGRAARLGAGVVLRCYDEETFARMPAHVTPQIASADLTEAALLLAAWGTPQGRGLPLPDAPPAGAMADAVATLRSLGAVEPAVESEGGWRGRTEDQPEDETEDETEDERSDEVEAQGGAGRGDGGRITEVGRELARIPVEPRLARALLDGAALVGARPAAQVVAALGDDVRSSGADLLDVLRGLRARRHPAAGRWADQVRRLLDLLPSTSRGPAPAERVAAPEGAEAAPSDAAGLVVALAYPERIARLDGASYLLASGTRAALPPGSALVGHDWLAIADVSRAAEPGPRTAGTGAVIRLAAPLSQEDALVAAAHLHREDTVGRWRDGRVAARRVEALGAIELSSTPVPATPQVGRAAVAAALGSRGLELLPWSDSETQLRRRLATLHHHAGEPWPDVSDAALLARLEEWFGPELDALAGGTRAERLDVSSALRRLLPWPAAARLDELVPERLTVPSGSQVRIAYPPVDEPEARPIVAVRLQECFGWAQTPRLVDGRLPVLFHLLSPAGRPLAVTDDLASFWSGPYAQVRAEMRGRYPKHPWPQDPWTEPPTARADRRR